MIIYCWIKNDKSQPDIVFLSLPIPSISLSRTSPGLRNSCGFLWTPTPAGVPVRITSPGYKVTILEKKLLLKILRLFNEANTHCDKYETKKSILKISSEVLPLCFKTPFTQLLMAKSLGSTLFRVTTAGPNGQNVSIDFPSRNCPLFLDFCQSRALISWATVYPKMWSCTWSCLIALACRPITTASSTSQSTCWNYLEGLSGQPIRQRRELH